jgi:type II secretory pathway pseudopilin PulG
MEQKRMKYAQTVSRGARRLCLECVAFTATLFLLTMVAVAQAPTPSQPEMPWSKDLKKYPGLPAALNQLMTRLQHDVQFPAARGQSRLLPLLPQATIFYAALPNYGDTAHQILTIFREQRQQSPALRDWWQHGDLATNGPKVEDSIEKFSQLSQYLGDEIVVSATSESRESPGFLLVAEVKKPGLKEFLQHMVAELADKSAPSVRVMDVPELAAAKDTPSPQATVVLVRPDFVVLSSDLATLRSFNSQLDSSDRAFPATPFGQRIAQEYEGGAELVAAADLQSILKKMPATNDQSQATFQRTGFADMKYLVWNHKTVPGQAASHAELSFTGPRHGVASWLTAPAPMGSLDFVSPKAILASVVLLKNLGAIFDDVKDLATSSNPNSFAMVDQMEQGMKLSLKDDLLSQLTGEIALEVDSAAPPTPVWKAILRVKDAGRLQHTFSQLLTMAPVTAQESEEGGVTYHSLTIPSPQKAMEISYVFVDGYLVIASSHATAAEAARLHRTGESLAKPAKFKASLPLGHSPEASALLYEDPLAMMALRLGQMSPDMAGILSQSKAETTPTVICAYGEPAAIREVSTSGGVDAGMVLIGAAIAIPNLLRAKNAANDAAAVGSLRTVVTAQVEYSTTYPDRGYAHDLATLGPASGPPTASSPDHAGLVDPSLAGASCTARTWCTKNGFRFRMNAVCVQQQCGEFVVAATPVAGNTGSRNFCVTSDGVIRFNVGPPLTLPLRPAECRRWPPLR